MRLNKHMQQELFPDMKINVKHGDVEFSLDREVISKIKHECSDIVKEYALTNKLLYRGTKTSRRETISDNVYKIIPRNDRKPKDTDPSDQRSIDDLFEDIFGWRPRSEGVFVSSSSTVAKSYGKIYVFFPVNGYKYVWSPNYEDLYSDYFENKTLYDEYDPFSYIGDWIDQETNEKFAEKYDIPYANSDYATYSYNGMKIDIYVDEDDLQISKTYLWVPVVSEEEWMDSRDPSLENVVETYQDRNLHTYLKGGNKNEMMFKCNYYYGILLPSNGSNGYYSGFTIKDLGFG